MQYTYFARWYWHIFWEHSLLKGFVVTIFSKFLAKCRPYVLLNEIAQKCIHKIYTIRKKRWCNSCAYTSLGMLQFCFFLNYFDSHIIACVEWNCKQNLYTRCILLEETLLQFVCTYLLRGRCNSIFSKILLIVISQLVVSGIAQKILHKIHAIRKKHWCNFCVHTSLGGAAILFFPKFFW